MLIIKRLNSSSFYRGIFFLSYKNICDMIVLVMNMKKFLSIIISFIMIVLPLSVSAFAVDKDVKLSLTSDSVYAGEEVTLNLFISDNSKMSCAVIDINYDKSALEFVSAKEGAILDPDAQISIRNIDGEKGKINFTYMSPFSSVTSEGILISITFRAKENSNGISDVTINISNPKNFINIDAEPIEFSVKNSKVTIINNDVVDMPTEVESSTEITDVDDNNNYDVDDKVNEDKAEKENNNIKDYVIFIAIFVIGVAVLTVGIILIVKGKKRR